MAESIKLTNKNLAAVASDLHRYKETLKKQETNGTLHKGGMGKSNQVDKLDVAKEASALLDNINAKNLGTSMKKLDLLIKKNQKATGSVLIHGHGDLDKMLKAAKKSAIESVPNGKAIVELHKYLDERREIVSKKGEASYKESSVRSDVPGKIKLAESLLSRLEKGDKISAEQINTFIDNNKKLTEGSGGLHRAGKLESILKDMQKTTPKP